MSSKITFLVVVVFGAASFLAIDRCEAQPALPSPDAKLCKLLPVGEIEAALGAKVGSRIGSDRDKFNSCTVNLGGTSVKIEYHQPGQPGLPTDVKTGLAGMTAAFGSSLKNLETREFGEIGCYRGVLAFGGQETKSTACFQPKGYYTFGVVKPGDSVPMETVKALLEKTAAAFKAP